MWQCIALHYTGILYLTKKNECGYCIVYRYSNNSLFYIFPWLYKFVSCSPIVGSFFPSSIEKMDLLQVQNKY